MENKEWYESWFDSPYYHILYKNRDGAEARQFIDHLVKKFNLTPGFRVMDLCCGKGRHAVYLNSIGFKVTGLDLSPRNIRYCKQFENENLEFYVHDMRHLFRTNYFKAIFNLFTSFGYFERDHYNDMSISAAAKGLQKGGLLIIDFMNAWRATHDLTPHHKKTVDGIEFNIHKQLRDGFIYKDITFSDSGSKYAYREEVKILLLKDFEGYMKHAGLTILNTFGDYGLQPFVQESSNRLIIVASK
ncbi:MAG: class I SAM-dependent methyltransferase [Bacteroidota bacterium]